MLFPNTTIELYSPIKWAGGKNFLIEKIQPLLLNNKSCFVECFAGSLALTLKFQPKKAIINDLCFPLINMWKIIKENPDELCEKLEIYANNSIFNNAVKFDEIRKKFNELKNREDLTHDEKIELAAFFIYLNKRSFNGLYRENQSGKYNVPFRLYNNCEMYDKQNILNISKYFNENDVQFFNGDFSTLEIPNNSLVYLDPPYYPSETSSFTQYTKDGFPDIQQTKLFEFCNNLNKRKISFIESNSPCQEIVKMYSKYKKDLFYIHRSMRSAKKGIDKKDEEDNEILIWNF